MPLLMTGMGPGTPMSMQAKGMLVHHLPVAPYQRECLFSVCLCAISVSLSHSELKRIAIMEMYHITVIPIMSVRSAVT